VAWPSGQVDRIGPTTANLVVTVQEGKGAVAVGPLPAKGQALRLTTGSLPAR